MADDEQQSGKLPPPQWVVYGRSAKSKAASLEWGERERGVEGLADSYGIAVQTLRRSISALGFAESFRDVEGIDLLSQPLNAVEDIRRWAARDRARAKQVAVQLSAGELSVRDLRRLESGDRLGRSADTEKVRRETPFSQFGMYADFYMNFRSELGRNSRFDVYPDLILTGQSDDTRRIGVIVAKHYFRESDQKRRITILMSRSLALSRLYDEVHFHIENRSDIASILGWMAKNGVPRNIIRFYVEFELMSF